MRILDLFCGAGGAAMGMHEAFPDAEIVGVDIKPQPRYPFTFVQADAMTYPLDGFDFVWASPPCQDHMRTQFPGQERHGTAWMLAATRERLQAHSAPWIIENVPGSPLRVDYRLCGCMFGLKQLRRERWFETSWGGFNLRPSCYHPETVISVVGHAAPSWNRKQLGYNPTIAQLREVMGIGWMSRNELVQAIPPAYSRYLLSHLPQAVPA